MKNIKLPRKPSRLIRIARRDLVAVMVQPEKYKVNMFYWHVPVGPICYVCQAGAVMANTFKVDSSKNVYPPTVSRATHEVNWGRLAALNELRQNHIHGFLSRLCPEWTATKTGAVLSRIKAKYTRFEVSPKKYLRWLDTVARQFERQGL